METFKFATADSYLDALASHASPFATCGGFLHSLSEEERALHEAAEWAIDDCTFEAVTTATRAFEHSKRLPACACCGETLGTSQTDKRTCSYDCTHAMYADGYRWDHDRTRWLSYWQD